jgi:Tfp pilus assembly protein PilN
MMNKMMQININLLSPPNKGVKFNLDLLLLALMLVSIVLAVSFHEYEKYHLGREQAGNLQLKEQLNYQVATISPFLLRQSNDQALIAKHQRIQTLINDSASHADVFQYVEKIVPEGVSITSVDILGTTVVVSGNCREYGNYATMIDNMEKGSLMTVSKSECTHNPTTNELNVVISSDWMKS